MSKSRGITSGKKKEEKSIIFCDILLTNRQTNLQPPAGGNYLLFMTYIFSHLCDNFFSLFQGSLSLFMSLFMSLLPFIYFNNVIPGIRVHMCTCMCNILPIVVAALSSQTSLPYIFTIVFCSTSFSLSHSFFFQSWLRAMLTTICCNVFCHDSSVYFI